MGIDPDDAQKPLRKLRKLLKRFPKDPAAEDVHALRTQTRRFESIAQAFAIDNQSATHRLLRLVAPIRKAAGSVRDMDVLTAQALTLEIAYENECVVRLLEHLGHVRVKNAADLRGKIENKKKKLRRGLRRCSRAIRKSLERRKSGEAKDQETAGSSAKSPTADALDLAATIAHWPSLNAGNIHAFRLKLKTLRYVLELDQHSDDRLLANIGEVKDLIGEWHDWQQLTTISEEVLDGPSQCALNRKMRSIERRKLRRALSAANALRNKYFATKGRGKHSNVALSQSLLRSAANLTA
jgi:CHAD domain-containing protein